MVCFVALYLQQHMCFSKFSLVGILMRSLLRFYLTLWMIIFIGAVLWTVSEKDTYLLLSEVTGWQPIVDFLFVLASQIYNIIPKEIHARIAPVISILCLY